MTTAAATVPTKTAMAVGTIIEATQV